MPVPPALFHRCPCPYRSGIRLVPEPLPGHLLLHLRPSAYGLEAFVFRGHVPCPERCGALPGDKEQVHGREIACNLRTALLSAGVGNIHVGGSPVDLRSCDGSNPTAVNSDATLCVEWGESSRNAARTRHEFHREAQPNPAGATALLRAKVQLSSPLGAELQREAGRGLSAALAADRGIFPRGPASFASERILVRPDPAGDASSLELVVLVARSRARDLHGRLQTATGRLRWHLPEENVTLVSIGDIKLDSM